MPGIWHGVGLLDEVIQKFAAVPKGQGRGHEGQTLFRVVSQPCYSVLTLFNGVRTETG